ncbi:chromate transporter [Caryophanon latum]|uniref:Transporter n=1 Tax=Caryophanon latum TaxID=33977 RepID=A0A1C0YJB3_9BACL|nr:chromate transporter [Caryophanon latum]OCS87272.1 transporter [Caryophanon latum]
MIYIDLFLAFFIPNIVGYGGGPATIPLIKHEVVEKYGWLTLSEYSEVLALGNALPGPIAIKIAAFVGYDQAGILGACITVLATVGPSLALMIALLGILYRNRTSPRVQRLSKFVLPAIAVLMLSLTFGFVETTVTTIHWLPAILLLVGSYIALEKLKWHPALVIVLALIIGGVFLS